MADRVNELVNQARCRAAGSKAEVSDGVEEAVGPEKVLLEKLLAFEGTEPQKVDAALRQFVYGGIPVVAAAEAVGLDLGVPPETVLAPPRRRRRRRRG